MEYYEVPFCNPCAGADTLVYYRFRDRESLSGEWRIAIDQYDNCLKNRWFEEKTVSDEGYQLPVDYSFDTWPITRLPANWNRIHKELKLYEGSVCYFRTWHYEPHDKDERVLLRIGAANYVSRVFINKRFVGMHLGGSTPFNMDITDFLNEDNRILIVVSNERRGEYVPSRETDWFNYGGIFREIEILRLPPVYIRDFRISLVPDGKFDKILISASLSEKVSEKACFELPALGIAEELPVTKGRGRKTIRLGKKAGELVLWSPDTPHLYDVKLTCGRDCVRDQVGLREFRVDGNDLLLNGRPIYLKGISCHENSRETGRALTKKEIVANLKLAKELGCNFMRAAHYPHSEMLAYEADRMGIMLWEEVPVYWGIHFENEETYKDAHNQLLEMIRRDFNRASVIIWSVGNENADTDPRLSFMGRLADSAREEDPARPVSAACLVNFSKNAIEDRLEEKLDIIGVNEYFGWYDPNFERLPKFFENSRPDKPVIITEFGADASSGFHGDPETKGTEECQAEVYRIQTDCLKDIPYVKGMSPWILHDFICPRRTSSLQNYYNTKGLVSADKRHRKLAFDVLKKFYASLDRK